MNAHSMKEHIQARRDCSIKRTGVRLQKNAQWFLEFSAKDPAVFDDRATFSEHWDDLISLALLASGATPPSSKKAGKEQAVTVRIAKGTLYQNADGQMHESGSVVELPAAQAIALVRGGSAAYASKPPVVAHECVTPAAALNQWEYAATWPARAGGDLEYQGCVRELRSTHEQIRRAIDGYLAGEEPIISLKEADFKLGPSPLTPISPLSAVRCTDSGVEFSGIEAPVLVQFLKVFSAVGKYFNRCRECAAKFLAKRTDRLFCSDGCRAKFSMRNLRAERKDAALRLKEKSVKRKNRLSVRPKSKHRAIRKGGKHYGEKR